MALTLKTAPASEPVTLTEAKAHLRVTDTSEDTLITSLITASRQVIEERLNRALITQTWELRLDEFPTDDTIRLPRPPLQSVSSVKYVDLTGTEQTLAGTEYTVDAKSEPARLVPGYGKSWPNTRDVPNAITIEFVAGFGAAADVPGPIKSACLLILGELFERREQSIVGAPIVKVPVSAEYLLWPYRNVVF